MLKFVTDLSVIDIDGRCLGIGEPAFFAKLLDEIGRSDWEILLQQPLTFCRKGTVGLVERALRLVWMHVSTIVAPASSLIPQREFDDAIQAVPGCEG